jgi:hypothetical protein
MKVDPHTTKHRAQFSGRTLLRGTAVDFGNAVVQCINRAHRLKKARSIKLIFIPTPR